MTGIVTAAVAASAASAPVAAVAATTAEVGFLAAVGGFIAGWALVILIVLALLGILAEYNESSGWSVFFMLVAAGVAYLAFNVSLMMIAIGAVAYIVIGLVWSFWRYKRHVERMVEKHKTSTQMERERILARLHPKEMIGTITAWILVWPFSFVQSIAHDLIDFIHSLVIKFFRGVYFKIYDSAVAALK